MSKLLIHLRTHIIRGAFAVIPVLFCVIALSLLYVLIDRKIIVFLEKYFDVKSIPGFGILLLLLFLLFLGFLVTNVVGKFLFEMIDHIIIRIPVIKGIYRLTRQISNALGQDSGDVYKKTVLINFPNPNQWSIAFLAGKITDDKTNATLYKVYVPMAHPMIGAVYFVEEKNVIDPGWSIPDGFKMVLTLGLVTPKIRF